MSQYVDFPHWLTDLVEDLRDDEWVQKHAYFKPGPHLPEDANCNFKVRAYWSDSELAWCADCYDCRKKNLKIDQHPGTFAWYCHICGECSLKRMEDGYE